MTKRGRNNKPSKRQLDDALLEPSLVALAKQLNNAALPLQQVTLPSLSAPFEDLRVSEGGGTVTLVGVGAPETGGCEVGRSVLLRYSAYYQHAASFGNPPAYIALDFGHRAVTLLARALRSGIVELGPAALPHLLQAAAYLQVAAVLEAAACYLQDHVLDSFPCPVLRVALDLQLSSLAEHIERDFLQSFFMLSGAKAAEMLAEWPPAKRRELLCSCQLCAPTECCVVETLCHLAKAASSADALALLCCLRLRQLSPGELAAATLYLHSNAAWMDRRLATALAWRLLNSRVAGDLETRGHGGRPGASMVCSQLEPAPSGSGDAGCGPRHAARRSLVWALLTAEMAAWTGTVMGCCARPVPCSWGPSRPMALQLEREDPRHAAAHSVDGGAPASGAGWDLQLSLDPDTFPAGFKATCFAFGADGFHWCALGPLTRPGPTWWKVGFLAQQLERTLPLAALADGGSCGGEGELLLVGWWVPEQ